MDQNLDPNLGPLDTRRLPLFPLTDEVHFPHTEIRLRVVEPEICALIEELFAAGGDDVFLGTVLKKPSWVQAGHGDVFPAGTAARLLAVERHEDGCDVWLRGEYRFEVEQVLDGGPCREALVRPVAEPDVEEADPGVAVMKDELLEHVTRLSTELGERFPLAPEHLGELYGDGLCFEETVNFLAAHLDLAPLAKLRLLSDALPDRASHLLSILRDRRELLEVLRPFRHLDREPGLN